MTLAETLWTLLAASCAICALYPVWGTLHERAKLRGIVFTNLDSAWEGGCFNSAEAGYLHEMTAAEIAADMELYCEECSGYDRNDLLRHVEAWLKANAEKVYPS